MVDNTLYCLPYKCICSITVFKALLLANIVYFYIRDVYVILVYFYIFIQNVKCD